MASSGGWLRMASSERLSWNGFDGVNGVDGGVEWHKRALTWKVSLYLWWWRRAGVDRQEGSDVEVPLCPQLWRMHAQVQFVLFMTDSRLPGVSLFQS